MSNIIKIQLVLVRFMATLQVAFAASRIGRTLNDPSQRERGQATAEYALVLLGAATVALLLVAWAAKSGKVSTLLNRVFDTIIGKVV